MASNRLPPDATRFGVGDLLRGVPGVARGSQHPGFWDWGRLLGFGHFAGAPTARNPITHGNALGVSEIKNSSPERASFSLVQTCRSRPFRTHGVNTFIPSPLGCRIAAPSALAKWPNFRRLPLWERLGISERAPDGPTQNAELGSQISGINPNAVHFGNGRERSRVPTLVGMALRAVRFCAFPIK